jgi:hypothetical protein
MAEWFAHGALHENPGLQLHGLDELRVLKGIRIQNSPKTIRLFAGKIRKNGSVYEIDLELRNGVREGKDIVHSRSRAVLTEELENPPEFDLPERFQSNGYPRSPEEIYEKILFHGKQLQAIQQVLSCSPEGMVARVHSAPRPEAWVASPMRNDWLVDPMVLDAAFQMASLWCYELFAKVSLPVYGAVYRQYRSRFPDQGVKVVLETGDSTESRLRADFTFVDAEGGVIAQLKGYEAVMDPALIHAFKPQKAATG